MAGTEKKLKLTPGSAAIVVRGLLQKGLLEKRPALGSGYGLERGRWQAFYIGHHASRARSLRDQRQRRSAGKPPHTRPRPGQRRRTERSATDAAGRFQARDTACSTAPRRGRDGRRDGRGNGLATAHRPRRDEQRAGEEVDVRTVSEKIEKQERVYRAG